jgi:hypothetical protein
MGFIPDVELFWIARALMGVLQSHRHPNIMGLGGRCLCHSCLKTKVEKSRSAAFEVQREESQGGKGGVSIFGKRVCFRRAHHSASIRLRPSTPCPVVGTAEHA